MKISTEQDPVFIGSDHMTLILMLWLLSGCSLTALVLLSYCSLSALIALWSWKMKIDCSRQTCAGRTHGQSDSLSSYSLWEMKYKHKKFAEFEFEKVVDDWRGKHLNTLVWLVRPSAVSFTTNTAVELHSLVWEFQHAEFVLSKSQSSRERVWVGGRKFVPS